MPANRLSTHAVAKPWGRRKLWPGFEQYEGDQPIGEIWFTREDGGDQDLLIKYLFTSEDLSVQVHPNDAQARERGFPRGKDEAWLILSAEPGATIALGPKRTISADDLREAARDGSIVEVLDWRPVAAGDFIYSPAGTVHAIGAGLTLIEVQQNLDLTYRLYDYGRPRELHLDDGAAVSDLTPFTFRPPPQDPDLLTEGPKFVVERLCAGEHALSLNGAGAWLVPVRGAGVVDNQPCSVGECWELSGAVSLTLVPGAEALLAYSGDRKR